MSDEGNVAQSGAMAIDEAAERRHSVHRYADHSQLYERRELDLLEVRVDGSCFTLGNSDAKCRDTVEEIPSDRDATEIAPDVRHHDLVVPNPWSDATDKFITRGVGQALASTTQGSQIPSRQDFVDLEDYVERKGLQVGQRRRLRQVSWVSPSHEEGVSRSRTGSDGVTLIICNAALQSLLIPAVALELSESFPQLFRVETATILKDHRPLVQGVVRFGAEKFLTRCTAFIKLKQRLPIEVTEDAHCCLVGNVGVVAVNVDGYSLLDGAGVFGLNVCWETQVTAMADTYYVFLPRPVLIRMRTHEHT